jgi:hypothetical protein
MPRVLLKEDQIQGLCVECNKNKQQPAPKSKLGFKRFIKTCTTCTKIKYGLPRRGERIIYRQHKKLFCEDCGFIAKDKCQLDVHHIDHNHKNNDPKNLKTLCANCHRLEHYKAR